MEKYLLCRTALETGFRKEELMALDKSRFHLGELAGVVLMASEEKAGRGVKQPISRELAGLLIDYFATMPDHANILHVPYKTGQMMQRLCNRAKVPYELNGQYADFHAWRHTFISRLANSAAPLWVVKALARHASITTTERYVHRRPADERSAVEAHGSHCAALALSQDEAVRNKLVQMGAIIRRHGGDA